MCVYKGRRQRPDRCRRGHAKTSVPDVFETVVGSREIRERGLCGTRSGRERTQNVKHARRREPRRAKRNVGQRRFSRVSNGRRFRYRGPGAINHPLLYRHAENRSRGAARGHKYCFRRSYRLPGRADYRPRFISLCRVFFLAHPRGLFYL